ncbi:unnamed protein product [Spirodela intermedia]|uniref:Dof zinc finger protein n=1 Tax=Spirodela intermedia TaxID=51605 RepID=A0A7I8I7B7_SPIIN|nr:unnamed protein product [Spirodela intermedia]CAA6653420.1 unnamed protein product [Spirodela intermedia]
MASFPADDLQGNKTRAGSGGGEGPVRPPEQGLKCPRCDSPNTKFCYYNNYSLAQPRYFCKTCRRYWTKGGALRNVPVGGGCRKTKKSKSSSIPATSSSGAAREHRFLQGLSSVMDFHLPSGLNHTPSGPGIFNMIAADGGAGNHLISYGDLSCSNAAALPSEAAGAIASPLIGFKYPIQLAAPHFTGMDLVLGNGGEATTTPIKGGDLAASIESLSSINQGLHWKLQQQRLASFFGGEDLHHHPYQGKGITDNTHALLEVPIDRSRPVR